MFGPQSIQSPLLDYSVGDDTSENNIGRIPDDRIVSLPQRNAEAWDPIFRSRDYSSDGILTAHRQTFPATLYRLGLGGLNLWDRLTWQSGHSNVGGSTEDAVLVSDDGLVHPGCFEGTSGC